MKIIPLEGVIEKTQEMLIGFVQGNPCVGAVEEQVLLIQTRSRECFEGGCTMVAFPELFLSGYPPGDLLFKPSFLRALEDGIQTLTAFTRLYMGKGIILGTPIMEGDQLFNAALLLLDGETTVICRKKTLPHRGVFDEKRWFSEGEGGGIVSVGNVALGVMICEDMWIPSISEHLASKSTALLALNASPYHVSKQEKRLRVAQMRVRETQRPLVYVNLWGGQDNLLFDGCSFALDHHGKVLSWLPAWQDAIMTLTITPQGIRNTHTENRRNQESFVQEKNCPQTWYQAALVGIRDYVRKNAIPGVLIGLSGGLDSALVATLAVDALGCESVKAVTMPSSITSKETLEDAYLCAKRLSIECETLSIAPMLKVAEETLSIAPMLKAAEETLSIAPMLKAEETLSIAPMLKAEETLSIAPMLKAEETLASKHKGKKASLVEENLQARLRGMLLMARANAQGWMVLATGNRSEFSLGYSTLYGDMCGGYAPLRDLYKTQIQAMAKWRNQQSSSPMLKSTQEPIPESILHRAPSAELRHGQTDEDSLGASYEIIDEILSLLEEERCSRRDIIARGYQEVLVDALLHRVKAAEHKRYQAPPGGRMHRVDMSLARRYPITNGFIDRL